MVLLTVDASSPAPAYRQICDQVVRLVDTGALRPGDRLPPTRTLARIAGVHRSTVMRAYGELWALGYLESRPGSYSTVRRRVRPPLTTQPAARGLIDWDGMTMPAGRGAHHDVAPRSGDSATPPGAIDFSRLSADPSLAPTADIRRAIKTVLLAHGGRILDYGDPAGYRPLRETVARRLRVHGVAVATDEILITSGAQHGLDLMLRLLARAGDRVVVESPSYASGLSLFRFHGLDVAGIPMRADGMDLDALERAMRHRRPTLVYTMPNFQNPTGITTSQVHRERLLALCEARRVPIVEDGFEEEMKYFGKAVLPIKSMDRHGIVLYAGTFSKVVFPGLRIGWIAAPRACIDRLAAIHRATCLSGNTLAQAAADRFCRSGRYEAHLRRAHAVHRRRMGALLRGLAEHMPRGVEWTEPAGGYTLWLRVGGAPRESVIHARCLQEGVVVAPGRLFFPAATRQKGFRLSIACVGEEEIGEGCRRLGRALRAVAR